MSVALLVLLAVLVGVVLGRGYRSPPVAVEARALLPPPPLTIARTTRPDNPPIALVLMDRDEREVLDCLWVDPTRRPRWVTFEDMRCAPASGSVRDGYFIYRELVH